jgi:type IV pilus assembly protein PilM
MGALRELAAALTPKVLGKAPLPAGICLLGDRLSAAQLERTPAGPLLQAAATLELGRPWNEMLDEPRRFGQMLKRFWREQGFARRDVVAAMPQEQLKVFTMEYSVSPGQGDAEAIAAELRDRLKDKASALVVDFVPVRQPVLDERSKEALIATAARADVISFLELLGHGGLNVLALDIAGMALKRLMTWAQKGGGDTASALLVNIGTASTQLMIVSGRRLILERSIEFGEARLVARVARLLELPEPAARRLIAEHAYRPDQAPQAAQIDAALREILGAELVTLKGEVAKTVEYAASKRRGAGIDRILLVGALDALPGIAQFLSAALGKPVELLDPLALFPHRLGSDEAARLAPHCGVAVAMGLALRGVLPS